jgi:hypothetical protein
MRNTALAILLLLTSSAQAWATNADSLGGLPWTSFFRRDVPDTAYGMKWFPDSMVLGTTGTGAVQLPFVTYLHGYNNIGDPMWAQIELYGGGILIDHPQASTGQYGINAIEENSDHVLVQLEAAVPLNTGAHLLRLTGMGYPSPRDQVSELMKIAEISACGIGLGIYNGSDSSTGIYIDQSSSGKGMRIENNEFSYGHALWIDNCNTGTALEISDMATGRIFRSTQDQPGKPALTLFYRGSQSGYPDDSSMVYWWGFKGRKAEAETIKTALCGLRSFGGANLCDTILQSGVAPATTVVTASYAGGFDAVTCNALRVKVAPDSIIVKRAADTDPGQYYWQATMVLSPGQVPGGVTINQTGEPRRRDALVRRARPIPLAGSRGSTTPYLSLAR